MQPNASYYDRLVKHYGTTDDPHLGAFLLPDGDFLDFSEGSGSRTQDHRNVTWVLPANWEGPRDTRYDGMVRVAKRAMMYRWMPESWSLEAWTLPTAKQLDAVEMLAEQRALTIEAYDGHRHYAATYEPYESHEAYQDLLAFFRGRDIDREFVPNKPWTDKVILHDWPKVLAFAKKHGLPVPTSTLTAKRKPVWEEFGCGVFGCVFPTTDPDVVFKVTSDESEASFILRVAGLRHVNLDGLVRYDAALPISGARNGHKLLAVWRQEAQMAGQLEDLAKKDKELHHFVRRLEQIVWFALGVKETLEKHKEWERDVLRDVARWLPMTQDALRRHIDTLVENKGKQIERWNTRERNDALEISMNMAAYAFCCDVMSKESRLGELVGKTMYDLLRAGILLADVHPGNVGLVNSRWVITDPGRMVIVDPNAKAVKMQPWSRA